MSTTAAYLDFLETTTSKDIYEEDALGLLNFSLLFDEKSYVNDTPLGDSDLLIRSFIAKTPLFTQITESLRSKILLPHFRSKVSIGQDVLYEGDEVLTTHLYNGWLRREELRGHDETTAAFTCPIHGPHRLEYHRELDSVLRDLLIRYEDRYDPDHVKDRFRNDTRSLLRDSALIASQLRALPRKMQTAVRRALDQQFFTLRDIYWPLREEPKAQDLLRALALVNQRSYATSARAAPLGAHQTGIALGELDLALAAPTVHSVVTLAAPQGAPQSVSEFFESASITLTLPSIKLLARLTPEQVLNLRETAGRTIFAVARNLDHLSLAAFAANYGNALREYVYVVDDNLARWHRRDALTSARSNAALGWGAVALHAARECWSGRWRAAAVSVRRTVARTLLSRKDDVGLPGGAVGGGVGAMAGALLDPVAGLFAGGAIGTVTGAIADRGIAKGVNSLLDYFMVLVCDRSEAAHGIAAIPDTWDRHVHVAGIGLEPPGE